MCADARELSEYRHLANPVVVGMVVNRLPTIELREWDVYHFSAEATACNFTSELRCLEEFVARQLPGVRHLADRQRTVTAAVKTAATWSGTVFLVPVPDSEVTMVGVCRIATVMLWNCGAMDSSFCTWTTGSPPPKQTNNTDRRTDSTTTSLCRQPDSAHKWKTLSLLYFSVQCFGSVFIEPGSGSGQKSQSGSGSRKALNPDPDPCYFFTLSEKKLK